MTELTVPRDVLSQYGLQDGAIQPLEGGLVNQHWSVALGDERFVLRRYHPARSRDAIEWEQWLVNHLATLGWPVARPAPTGDGASLVEHDGQWWALAPFLAGEPGTPQTPEAYARQGERLAELHDNLAGIAGAQRPGFAPHWDLDAWTRVAGGESFETSLRRLEQHARELANRLRAEHERQQRELTGLGVESLPLQPVHGDFQRSNLLWAGGSLVGIVDFDFCHLSAPVADLAVLGVPFRPLEIEFARALLEGYESVRPLSEQEWELLVPLARASLLRWIAVLLGGWPEGAPPPAGVETTLTVRIPALDEAADALGGLRRRK